MSVNICFAALIPEKNYLSNKEKFENSELHLEYVDEDNIWLFEEHVPSNLLITDNSSAINTTNDNIQYIKSRVIHFFPNAIQEDFYLYDNLDCAEEYAEIVDHFNETVDYGEGNTISFYEEEPEEGKTCVINAAEFADFNKGIVKVLSSDKKYENFYNAFKDSSYEEFCQLAKDYAFEQKVFWYFS